MSLDEHIEHIMLDSAPPSNNKNDQHESFSPDSSSNTTTTTANVTLSTSRRQSFQINNKQNATRLVSNLPPSLQSSLQYASSIDSVNSTCNIISINYFTNLFIQLI